MKSEITDKAPKQKAIFLDRDGVINVERSYICKPDEFEVFDFTPAAIKKINTSNYKAIVVTNQSAIARNMCTIEELSVIHKKMDTVLEKAGAKVDAIYFCPHHPDKSASKGKPEYLIDCNCRKPKPGMLLNAAKDFNINLHESIMIGDTERDILSGKNAGCYTAGVITGYGLKSTKIFPDYIFTDLLEATSFLTNRENELLFNKLSIDLKKIARPYIIGIGGSEFSGKSNIASYLKMRFEQSGKSVLKLSVDDWLLPDVSDEAINKEIEFILNGNAKTIEAKPKYPNAANISLTVDGTNTDVIIIEGINTLQNKILQKYYSKRLQISASIKKQSIRLHKFYNWLEKTEVELNLALDTLKNQKKETDVDIVLLD